MGVGFATEKIKIFFFFKKKIKIFAGGREKNFATEGCEREKMLCEESKKTRSRAEVTLFIQELKLPCDLYNPNRKVRPKKITTTVTLLLHDIGSKRKVIRQGSLIP